MKILIGCDKSRAHAFVRQGLAKVFQTCGHQVKYWHYDQESAFDVFERFKADLLITQLYSIDRPLFKCIKNSPWLRVICKIPDWSSLIEKIDLNKYPILVANDEHKKLVERLKKETGQPEFGFIHYHPDYIQQTHGYWEEKLGLKVISLMNGLDVFLYCGGEYKEEFASDLYYAGGLWGYKGQTIGPYINQFIHPIGKYRIKLSGVDFGGFGALKSTPIEVGKHFYRSTKVGLNCHEPHSQVFGFDGPNERTFKILANKTPVVSDYVEGQYKLFPKEIYHAKNPQKYKRYVDAILNGESEEEAEIMAVQGYKKVLNKHTYFHRIISIWRELGEDFEADKTLKVYNQLRQQNNL